MTEIFEIFTKDFYKWIRESLKKDVIEVNSEEFGLIELLNYVKIFVPDTIKTEYELIMSKITNFEDNIEESFELINSYIHYLRFVEKCFIYENSDQQNVYSEIIDDKEIIYFIFNGFKVKIEFEVTKIPDIIKGSKGNEPLKFVNMEIVRNFGKQMRNEFKFILKDNIELELESDEILFINMLSYMMEYIKDSFISILLFILRSHIGRNNIYNIETLFKKGIWVRR